MNPYKEGGPRTPRARRSFEPAYCKRCAAPPSVNDGYMVAGRRPPRRPRPPNAIASIETLVRQRNNRAFIMRV